MSDMTDRDNITLPREVVQEALEAFEAVRPFSTTQRELKIRAVEALRTHLAAPSEDKTPAWWRDGLAATLMREGVSKHRAREIAAAYWEAYCQIPKDEEEPT